MKIQKIKESPITSDDVLIYKEAISKLEGFMFTAADVNIDKRIITIRLGNIEDELTLVNPIIENTAETPLVYFHGFYKAGNFLID
jgi:peptide deformylase